MTTETLNKFDTTIRKSIFVAAQPEVVWGYLTKADLLATWFHPAEKNLAEGEPFTLISQKDGERMCWGKVIKMRAPDYMIWDFTVGPLGGVMTRVEWHVAPAPGGTRLSLDHSGLPAGEDQFNLLLALDKGWHGFLLKLRETTDT